MIKCRNDVMNWLERLGARQVAIDLAEESLPRVDPSQLSALNTEPQVRVGD